MGIMPEVWFDMEMEDFMLMQKGFFNRRKEDHLVLGKVAFYTAAIHQNWLAKKSIDSKAFLLDFIGEKAKPLTQKEIEERNQSIMARVELANKVLLEKEKNRKRKTA